VLGEHKALKEICFCYCGLCLRFDHKPHDFKILIIYIIAYVIATSEALVAIPMIGEKDQNHDWLTYISILHFIHSVTKQIHEPYNVTHSCVP
jgi:hypothetical protein